MPSLLHSDQVLDVLRMLPGEFNTDPDTLDQLPSYEYYFMRAGNWQHSTPVELVGLLRHVRQAIMES